MTFNFTYNSEYFDFMVCAVSCIFFALSGAVCPAGMDRRLEWCVSPRSAIWLPLLHYHRSSHRDHRQLVHQIFLLPPIVSEGLRPVPSAGVHSESGTPQQTDESCLGRCCRRMYRVFRAAGKLQFEIYPRWFRG